jgi:hypothetical protein
MKMYIDEALLRSNTYRPQYHLLKWHQQNKKNTPYGVLPIGIYEQTLIVDAKSLDQAFL